MWNNQIILILCMLYIGDSLAKSFQPTSFDYDYLVEGRNAPRRHRGKSATTTTPRPLIQQYWQSFVRNLPTLPPFSWNITNPIGNLFNAGAQEIIETPVAMHYMMEEEPNRIRRTKTSKRKSSKKGKNRKGLQRNYYSSYDNGYDNAYQQTQLQLQPLGIDQSGIMHFYDPSSGQYYALQQETQPNYHNNQYGNQYNTQHQYNSQYNNYAENGYDDEDDDGYGNESGEYYNHNGYDSQHGYDADNGYDSEQGYDSDNGYDSEQGYESDDGYDSEQGYESEHNGYDNDGESYNDGHMEYDDGVELADNWGYNDEEIFSDRKLKDGPPDNIEAIAGSIIKIQKHLLKPETEEDVKLLLSNLKKPTDKNDKTPTKTETTTENQETNEKTETTDNEEVESVRSVLGSFKKAPSRKKQLANTKKQVESVRNALGSFMKDDAVSRRKQTANTKISTHLVEKPRGKEKYYIFPANFWL